MKKALLAAAVLVPLTLTTTGCVISVDGDGEYNHHSEWDREHKNRREIAKLETSLSVSTVKRRMGTPDFNELHQREGDEYQVLYYRTNRREGDGMTTKDECTPLVFKNGELVGWGENAYQEI